MSYRIHFKSKTLFDQTYSQDMILNQSLNENAPNDNRIQTPWYYYFIVVLKRCILYILSRDDSIF